MKFTGEQIFFMRPFSAGFSLEIIPGKGMPTGTTASP